MNAIKELLTEHEAVRMTLKILERITEEIDKTEKISKPEHLKQLFEFFSVFVDKCHHGKEEELLFPALETVGISRKGGPIGVMLNEHQQGRDLVAKMKRALSQYLNGDAGAAQKLKVSADAYIALLNLHIDKENNVLFPMAEQHLSENKLAELKNGFDKIETDKIGTGKHEEFHRMLDILENTYLKDS
ncbi:MAG: hemerythrin domain-containing protein [Desulfobacteraceae bacterium]|nr:hemerythrin domain-containing protein [Desulfobacteraceae bacterium]MDH3838304.1 hemerythrin domain-containing protein [Desulfobacteraceae bacterium]